MGETIPSNTQDFIFPIIVTEMILHIDAYLLPRVFVLHLKSEA